MDVLTHALSQTFWPASGIVHVGTQTREQGIVDGHGFTLRENQDILHLAEKLTITRQRIVVVEHEQAVQTAILTTHRSKFEEMPRRHRVLRTLHILPR